MQDVRIVDYLTDKLADFNSRLKDISKVDGINYELVKIFRSNLDAIREDVEQTGKFGGLLKKVDRYRSTLDMVERLPDMEADFETLREQSIVLVIGAFEVFVGDIFKSIANNNPDYYVWPEKDKKIAIDIDNFTASFTLGDAIIAHLDNKQYSFQDLGSIIRAMNDYLGVEIIVDKKIRDIISLGTASRHLIVHRASVVDRQFLSQTRNISGLTYIEGDRIQISEEFVGNLKESIIDFSEQLVQTLVQRDEIK